MTWREPQDKSVEPFIEFLKTHEVDALLGAAPTPMTRLLFLVK